MAERRSIFGRMFGNRDKEPAAPVEETPPSEEAASTAVEPATVDPASTTPAPEPPRAIEPPPAPPMLAPPPAMVAPAPPTATVTPTLPAPRPVSEPPKRSWLQRLRVGLARSSNALSQSISAVFTKRRLDDAALDELEEMLIRADLGVETAAAIADVLRIGRYDKEISDDEVRQVLATEVARTLKAVAKPLVIDGSRKPHVILVVGVNGTGKTTTIGKLAARLRAEDKSVILAAGDTFRAAAVEQLKIWGNRTGAKVISGEPGGDAAGLAFDALTAARNENADVLVIDTAGRLQNRDELMAELEKIVRVVRKIDATAPHSVLLTLDATTGQNALQQVEIFGQRAGVTGLVMTKLDGTARGGILVAIAGRYGLPVHFIGVGESVDDLAPFSADDFAKALVGL